MNKRRYEPNANMNLTSMLDVVFMLLIIFIIAAPIMDSRIDLSLPQSSSAQTTDESSIELSIDKTGNVFLGQTQVEWKELPARLRAFKEDKNINSVALRGAKEVDYGTIMMAIDAIKDAGIDNLGLVALPKTK